MSLRDAVRAVLGIKPVKVGELDRAVSSPRPVRTRVAVAVESVADIEVVPEYGQVCALLEAKAPLLFVTGGAGTGKSTLIRFLRSTLTSRIAVVAPTGVAALTAGGVTIHSLFRLPPSIIQAGDIKKLQDRQLFTKLDLLIIDEVSMVRPDVLDGVDQFLRLNRGVDAPFGGVQILLVGDLFQLPPVVPEEERRALRQLSYSTDFFFSAAGIADSPLVPIVLQRVFRQTDAAFIALLNDLREGRRVSEALRAINERCVGPGDVVGQELMLTCTNHVADERNLQELSRLASASRTYVGTVTGEFRVETTRLPAPANLEVKAGAQVMFTKNDDRKRWVNGTIGRVVELGTRTIKVTLDRESSRETFEVEPVTWEQYRYRYNEAKECIEREVVGKYQQLPLMLAWAVTIHKAQGKTLDRIFVDLGSGAFSPGQVYVALSRVRALADLRLARPIRRDEVTCDPSVTAFYRQLTSMTHDAGGE